jgi:hypothetical protein
MTDTPAEKTPLSVGVWLELHTKEFESIKKSLEGERKNRGKREFILLITCLLALLYTYPINGFETNPLIEIPAISLKIPLRDAVAVFPTLIAAVYLVFLASAIGESVLMVHWSWYAFKLNEFRETGAIPQSDKARRAATSWRFLFLPSPLHMTGVVFGAAAMAKAIVDGFVGFVFSALPYATQGFIIMRSWRLLSSWPLLIWNCLCLLTMVLALLGAVLGSRPRIVRIRQVTKRASRSH